MTQFGDIDAFEDQQRQKAEEAKRIAEKAARQGSFGQLLDVYVEQLPPAATLKSPICGRVKIPQ